MAGPLHPLAHPPLKPHVVAKPATAMLEYGTSKPPLQQRGNYSGDQDHHRHEWICRESSFTDEIPYVCRTCLQFMSKKTYSEMCAIVMKQMERLESASDDESPLAKAG